MGTGMILLGASLLAVGIFAPAMNFQLQGVERLLAAVAGVVLMNVGAVATAYTHLYRKASADRAFVRTGAGGAVVVMDAGTFVLPILHSVIEVNLRTMKLSVSPRGHNALLTKDHQRADALVHFHVKVRQDEEHILAAARSFGEDTLSVEAVEAMLGDRLESALRVIASQMDLAECESRREEFAEKVKEHVRAELDEYGLLLENVTLVEVAPTGPSGLPGA